MSLDYFLIFCNVFGGKDKRYPLKKQHPKSLPSTSIYGPLPERHPASQHLMNLDVKGWRIKPLR